MTVVPRLLAYGITTAARINSATLAGVVIATSFALLLAPPRPARAATFTVPSGDVRALIAAIKQANTTTEPDTIVLQPGTYTLRAVDNDTNGPNGLPSITSVVIITGSGSPITAPTIARDPTAPAFRIFHVALLGQLTLHGVTITGGSSPHPRFGGGGIYNRGSLFLNEARVTLNTAAGRSDPGGDGSGGGGIANERVARISNSTISSNRSTSSGGGIDNTNTITLLSSTLHGNVATFDGGGLENGGVATISDGVIDGNEAGDFGGGVNNFSQALGLGPSVSLTNSTVSNNTAGLDGGGSKLRAATSP